MAWMDPCARTMEVEMRNVVRLAGACIVVVALGLLAGGAWAGIVNLGHHSQAEITKTCAGAGGSMYSGSNGEYGCTKGANRVECSNQGQRVGVCSNCGTRVGGAEVSASAVSWRRKRHPQSRPKGRVASGACGRVKSRSGCYCSIAMMPRKGFGQNDRMRNITVPVRETRAPALRGRAACPPGPAARPAGLVSRSGGGAC